MKTKTNNQDIMPLLVNDTKYGETITIFVDNQYLKATPKGVGWHVVTQKGATTTTNEYNSKKLVDAAMDIISNCNRPIVANTERDACGYCIGRIDMAEPEEKKVGFLARLRAR